MTDSIKRGPIAWMARHTVASNLLMVMLVLGGFMAVFTMKQEVFPEFDLDMGTISVPFPGATPEEVEQGIVLVIEERLRGLDGVKSITSTSSENVAAVMIELQLGQDANKLLADIKNEVDRITSFPEEIEEPTVALASNKQMVLSLLISGGDDLKVLHDLAEQARSELLALDGITQIALNGVPPLEMEVSIDQATLESYGISIDDVAQQIRMNSVELGAGSLDTDRGKILIKVSERKLTASEFASIPIRAARGGTEITLGDIAKITDGYEESDRSYYYNDEKVVELLISRVGSETPKSVATTVKKYLIEYQKRLPDNIRVSIWNDQSVLLSERIDLLVKNAGLGLILVVIILGLFLQRKLAFWVALGIPISFLGAFLLMSWGGVSINMITLFALIVTLGMVVDDAIVVAENVYHKLQIGVPPLKAAIDGTLEMAVPVTFSILTTVAAFSPLLFVPGMMGKIFFLIPAVVILVLLMSLLECYFILPAHLAHSLKDKGEVFILFRGIDYAQEHANAWLTKMIENRYKPFVTLAIKNRWLTFSIAFAVLIMVLATVPAGVIKFSFFPKMEGNAVTASIRLPFGVPLVETKSVRDILVAANNKAAEHFGKGHLTGTYIQVGQGPVNRGPHGATGATGSHLLAVKVQLVGSDERTFSAEEYATVWKSYLPDIPGVEALSIGAKMGPSAGKEVEIQLSHFNKEILEKASNELYEAFQNYPALTDVETGFSSGKPQMDFKMKPGAQALGVTSMTVARALRSSVFGAEALREQRGRNELKVMVRLPKHERSSEGDINQMRIRTASGSYVPLTDVASFSFTKAPTSINREDGRMIINVGAEIVPGASTAAEMIRTIDNGPVKKLLEKYPALKTAKSGMEKEKAKSFGSLGPNYLLAMIGIFALLAIPFRSYMQPLIVMSAIPFGFVGAILGHLILGYGLSFISVMGIIALSGVVVNDSLVLIDSVNKYRAEGMTSRDAIVTAGMRRFRPIMLTSLTTFFGLMPMIFETSIQAKFLIPMAISLGFGALFVTAIVLIVVPALYIMVNDIQKILGIHAEENDVILKRTEQN